MASAVKTLLQVPPTGRDFLLSSHIPFLDGNGKDPDHAFATTFQTDFKSFSTLTKRGAVPLPLPAQVEHRDLDRIKEYLTEAVRAYQHPQKRELSRTPAWTKLETNFKMHTDPREVTCLTTQSQCYQPHPPSSAARIIRPADAIDVTQRAERVLETTHRASFSPYQISPIVQVQSKHLEGFPTVKGDKGVGGFSSHYNETFRGEWHRPPQPVEKQSKSSVPVGDPGKVVERETTHATSFRQPGASSSANVRERLKINLGDYNEDPWTSTSMDAFCEHKSVDPVVLTQGQRNASSLPRGDTDQGRNRETLTATTNSSFFSERTHRQHPERVSGANLRTKSNVEFSRPGLAGRYYRTTTEDNYPQRDGERAQPTPPTPAHVLAGHEPGPRLTTVQADFLSHKIWRQRLSPWQLGMIKESHIRPPSHHHHFNTTHNDTFNLKPLSVVRPDSLHGPYVSHFIIH